MFGYRILRFTPFENWPGYVVFIPQYKQDVNSAWRSYLDGRTNFHHTWDDAYSVLEKHANPAQLQVKFVGTF